MVQLSRSSVKYFNFEATEYEAGTGWMQVKLPRLFAFKFSQADR